MLTLDAKAQKVADDALAGKCGAAVALEPATGKVLVMASSPPYDPNLVEQRLRQASGEKAPCSPAAPLLNRATAGPLHPGLDLQGDDGRGRARHRASSRRTRASTTRATASSTARRSSNFGADQSGPEAFGHVSFTQALQHSINSVFCKIGKKLGADGRSSSYAKRFGFYSTPPLETPAQRARGRAASTTTAKLYEPKHPTTTSTPAGSPSARSACS